MANYLDYTGLTKYDLLIKALIKSGDDALVSRINEIAGGSDVDMSLADVVSLIGEVGDGETLKGLIDALDAIVNGDASVEGSVNARLDDMKSDHDADIAAVKRDHKADIDHIKELLESFLGNSDGSDIDINDLATMGEVRNAIKRLEELIGIIDDSDSDPSLIERVEDLEAREDVYVPAEALVNNTGLISTHAGVENMNASDWKDKRLTMSQMFDYILFPTDYPSVKTAPSIAWNGYSSQTLLVGTDVTSYILTDETVDAKVKVSSYGAWDKYNSGSAVYGSIGDITLRTKTGVPSPNSEGKYILGTTVITYMAQATFSDGVTPKDNKGNDCASLKQSDVTKYTSAATITPYYDWYATTATAGVLTKQTAKAKCGITVQTYEVTLMNKTATEAQQIRTPKKITDFYQFNPLDPNTSTQWVSQMNGTSIKGWEEVQETDTENGLKYYVYTYTGADRDSVKIKIKF